MHFIAPIGGGEGGRGGAVRSVERGFDRVVAAGAERHRAVVDRQTGTVRRGGSGRIAQRPRSGHRGSAVSDGFQTALHQHRWANLLPIYYQFITNLIPIYYKFITNLFIY